jgi:hypothetical protein
VTPRKPIQEELLEIAPTLAGFPSNNPYSVPGGYFEMLPQTILDRIADARLVSGIAAVGTSNPYSVPEGYFNNLHDSILARVKAESQDSEDVLEELKSISPVLAGMNKKMPFTVPGGYFETLGEKAIPAAEQRPAKVISLSVTRVFRYAAAAVIAGIVAVATWMYMDQSSVSTTTATATVDTSTEEQLLSRIDNLSDTEIANFVEVGGPVYTFENNTAGADVAEADFTLMFEEVSDEELERYLQTTQPAKEKFN